MIQKQAQHQNVKKVTISKQQHFSGPIPDPSSLEAYNNIVPGSADRIIAMAENEARNRHKIENRLSKNVVITTMLGIVFAFLSVIILAGLAFYALLMGYGQSASTIAVGSIAAVAGVFVFFRSKSSKRL